MSEATPYGGSTAPGPDPRKLTAAAQDTESPRAEAVEKFHRNADTDSTIKAIHHSIGIGDLQAAPGTHTHDGTTSRLILEGFTLTGDRSDGTALLSVIQALERLGATDSTVA